MDNLEERVKELGEFFQGPFDLGNGLIIRGMSDSSWKWQYILPLSKLPDDLSGMRVLEIGSNAGYDSFQLRKRNPEYLLAIEPWEHYFKQAVFLQEYYGTDIDFQQIGWESLDASLNESFDLVVCIGIIYHEINPGNLLKRIHSLLKPGGMLLMESHVLREPHLTEFARFIEGTFLGQDHYWWIFGRECLQAMLRTYGFVEVEEFFYQDSPYTFNPDSDEKTVEGYDKGGLSFLQCRKRMKEPIRQTRG